MARHLRAQDLSDAIDVERLTLVNPNLLRIEIGRLGSDGTFVALTEQEERVPWPPTPQNLTPFTPAGWSDKNVCRP